MVWVVKLGGLAHSTISYGAQGVRQDHADLNTLRASRTHQENTLSYSRRQEMGLAAVEQCSIKQTSVLFQSHTYIRVWRLHDFGPPPPPGSWHSPRRSGFSLTLLRSVLLTPLPNFLRDPDIPKVFVIAGAVVDSLRPYQMCHCLSCVYTGRGNSGI